MMDSETRISISEEQYVQLLMDQCELVHLQSNGVDNWEWYGEDYKGLVQLKKDVLHEKLPKLAAEEHITRLGLNEVDEDA